MYTNYKNKKIGSEWRMLSWFFKKNLELQENFWKFSKELELTEIQPGAVLNLFLLSDKNPGWVSLLNRNKCIEIFLEHISTSDGPHQRKASWKYKTNSLRSMILIFFEGSKGPTNKYQEGSPSSFFVPIFSGPSLYQIQVSYINYSNTETKFWIL